MTQVGGWLVGGWRVSENNDCEAFALPIKNHLSKYFEDNNIILKNHHGGLKGKSTATARAVVEHKIEDGYQKKKQVSCCSQH